MIIKVHPHYLELVDDEKTNERESHVSDFSFEFDDEITDEFTKEAYFTKGDNTYKVIIQNDRCDYAPEVLTSTGYVDIGVSAFKVVDDKTIRYNPTPITKYIDEGSMKEAENSEEVTPTDKEQMEQMLNNINIEAEKVEHTTTISITNTDGETQQVKILDGEKGEKGDAGSIKFIIVQELPTEDIDESAMYLVPITPDIQGNNYAEYIYVNGEWELLGKIGVQIDLTDYVKNTDYASGDVGGVIKTHNNYGISTVNGYLVALTKTYEQYQTLDNYSLIGKGSLDNVITGKGLISSTDYASASKGGVIRISADYNTSTYNGYLFPQTITYEVYLTKSNQSFISKGTLENVITGKDLTTKAYVDGLVGNIETILEELDIGNGV